jgi:hypothetical protein
MREPIAPNPMNATVLMVPLRQYDFAARIVSRPDVDVREKDS